MAKIVHIITTLATGGGQTLMLNLARESAKRHDVTIISLISECELDVSDLNVIFLDKKPGLDIKMFFKLYKTLKKIEPDAVHTHLYAAVYAFLWFWLSKKRRGIHTIHSDASRELRRPHMLIQRLLYHRRNVTPTAISNTIKRQAQQIYSLPKEKVALVYNAIDVDRFRYESRSFDSDTFTFVQVASFNPWKNQRLLLDAFYNAHQSNPKLRLMFVGDGPDRGAIEERVRELGLESDVTFLGNVSDVENVLRRGDAFVLSSVYEGLPMSVLEAYASAMPVISTDVGGVGDILKNGVNGFLTEPQSEQSLAQAMLALCSDRELCKKMSERNLAYADEFDIKKAAAEYEKLYFG